MHTDTRKLHTISTETATEHNLVEDFARMGAHGYALEKTFTATTP